MKITVADLVVFAIGFTVIGIPLLIVACRRG